MRINLLIASLLLICTAAADAADATTWQDALANLKQGNQRYLQGITKYPRIDPVRRLRTATKGQKPIASILSCADARVPVETAFDKAFGDLFVVRVAGNVCEMAELASIEYGVLYLHTPLVVVLGHSQCGAVQAAITGGDALRGSLPLLMREIRPAVDAVRAKQPKLAGEHLEDAVIEENVRQQMAALLKSPGIKEAVDSNQVAIVGAVRNLKTGKIQWLKN